jgi:NAD(P)-dependent dehydrogenase (short-subunit alcohol dehydrogenase family)
MGRFKDKVAIITGGSGSIGFTTARRMAKEGAQVLIVDVDEEELRRKSTEAKNDGLSISHFKADVTDGKQVEGYVEECLNRFGQIDYFFNNAGIEGEVKPIHQYDDAVFDKVLAVNVKGVYLGMKYVIPKISDGGSIVISSSVAGLQGTPGMVAYITSKHATIGIMRTAALELGERKVRVNTINPGVVDNRMMRSLEDGLDPGNAEDVKKNFEQQIPLGRYAKPDDITNMATFLFSDEASYCHGNVFVVDGGMGA